MVRFFFHHAQNKNSNPHHGTNTDIPLLYERQRELLKHWRFEKAKCIKYKTLEILKVGTWKARQYMLMGVVFVHVSFLIFSTFFLTPLKANSQPNVPNNLLGVQVWELLSSKPAIIYQLITVKG